MSSLNKVTLIGHLGGDPEIKAMKNGGLVCNMSIATTEKWKDKKTGEARERTEWHRIVIFGDGLINVVQTYLKKGSKVYIEGAMQTRKWEKDGQDHYSTEVVLQGFGGKLIMLDGIKKGEGGTNESTPQDNPFEVDDEIPF